MKLSMMRSYAQSASIVKEEVQHRLLGSEENLAEGESAAVKEMDRPGSEASCTVVALETHQLR